MKINMKKTVIALLSVAVLGTGGYFAYNAMTNSAKKQDVAQLKVDDSSKLKDSKKSKNSKDSDVTKKSLTDDEFEKNKSSVKKEIDDDSNKSDSDESKTDSKDSATIDDNIYQIGELVESLNNFKNASNKAYENLKSQFAKYNVTLDDTVKGPYGLFDPISDGSKQSAVLAGITLDTNGQQNEAGYSFKNTIRVGQGAMNGSASATGGIIQKALKTDKYKDTNKEVEYQLDVSEDRKSATLKLVSGQWW
jgi:hypothetical protein